jgi:hypothetical protein
MRKYLLLIIYTENKPSTDYTTKTEKKMLWNIIKIYLPISLETKCACVKPRFLKIGSASHTSIKGVHKLLRVISIFIKRYEWNST